MQARSSRSLSRRSAFEDTSVANAKRYMVIINFGCKKKQAEKRFQNLWELTKLNEEVVEKRKRLMRYLGGTLRDLFTRQVTGALTTEDKIRLVF